MIDGIERRCAASARARLRDGARGRTIATSGASMRMNHCAVARKMTG
jgi:hypothetical protein